MTKEAQQIVAMFNAGNDEFRSFVIRVISIYLTGSEAAKQIIDEAAERARTHDITPSQLIEYLDRAERIA